jgi:hypothetical protein
MTNTVPCPECHQPARVLDSFTEEHGSGAIRYLRLQCEGPLSFLVAVEDVNEETSAALPEGAKAARVLNG